MERKGNSLHSDNRRKQGMRYAGIALDGLVKSHPLGRLCKKAKVKARESRGARRTDSTPQRQRDEAQRRDWPFYAAIMD